MKMISNSFLEEKKSKFYGYLFEINSLDEVKLILDDLKKQNKGYRHMPYAYILSPNASKSNDKEPGNIGLSFLNILERENKNNHLIIVIRYFGGTLLGASKLFRMYTKCANELFK